MQATAAELVGLGEDDGERHTILPEPLHELQVNALRLMATVEQDEEARELLATEDVRFDDLPQPVTVLATASGVTVSGQVDQVPAVVDDEMVDELRLTGLLRRHGQLFASRQHIDQRRLADVRPSDKGILRHPTVGTPLHVRVTRHELCTLNFHLLLCMGLGWMKAFCSCFLSGNSRPTLFQESVGIDLRLDLTGQGGDTGAEVFDQRGIGVVGAGGVHLRLAALARLDALAVEADVVERSVGEGAGLAVIILPEGTAGVHRRGSLGREGEGLACAWAGRVDIEDLELALSCRLCLGQLAADKVVHEMALKRVLCADLCF